MFVVPFPMAMGVDVSAECSFTVLKAVNPTFYDHRATVRSASNLKLKIIL